MQLNTKPLEHAIESAEKRLAFLKARPQVDVEHEIGALYNLFLTLAEAVRDLQREHNG